MWNFYFSNICKKSYKKNTEVIFKSLQDLEAMMHAKKYYGRIPGLQDFYCKVFGYTLIDSTVEFAVARLEEALVCCEQVRGHFTDQAILKQLDHISKLMINEIYNSQKYLASINKQKYRYAKSDKSDDSSSMSPISDENTSHNNFDSKKLLLG